MYNLGAGQGTKYTSTYTYGTGASYGGEGGAGNSDRSAPYAYGSFNRPALFGSSGGHSGKQKIYYIYLFF